jgi:hypothetical protein
MKLMGDSSEIIKRETPNLGSAMPRATSDDIECGMWNVECGMMYKREK